MFNDISRMIAEQSIFINYGIFFLLMILALATSRTKALSTIITALSIVYLVMIGVFSDYSQVSVIWSSLYVAIGAAAAYFGIGAMWSVFKHYMWLYSNTVRAGIQFEFDQYQKENAKAMSLSVEDFMRSYRYDKFRAKSRKDEIAAWIAFWPISLVWTSTYDFAMKVYEVLGDIYDGMTRAAVKDVLNQPTKKESK